MSGLHYRLKPMDMALFRDGRPFDAVDAHGARLLSLMPAPLTVYGALRQMIVHEAEIPHAELRSGKGTAELGPKPDLPGTLALGAIVACGTKDVTKEEVQLLPPRADLVRMESRALDELFFGYQIPVEGPE